ALLVLLHYALGLLFTLLFRYMLSDDHEKTSNADIIDGIIDERMTLSWESLVCAYTGFYIGFMMTQCCLYTFVGATLFFVYRCVRRKMIECAVMVSRRLRPVVAAIVCHLTLFALGAQPWLSSGIFIQPLALLAFPDEILLEIMERLSFTDRLRMRAVNHHLYDLESRTAATAA
ncbi:hypothetical protein PENTCL1PPCAC_22147, partial [Pristionchus entomophagus]